MSLGTAAYPLTGLKLVKGDPVNWSSTIGHGKVIALEFWASWCGPCVKTAPILSAMQQKYSDAIFVGVSSEDEKTVRTFVNQMGNKMSYRVAADEDYTLTRDYHVNFKVQGIPHAFLIDKSGKIRYSGHPADPRFESTLSKLLNEPATAGAAAGGKDEDTNNNKKSAAADKEKEGTAKAASAAVDVKGMSREQIGKLSVKELKQVLAKASIDYSDCVEKVDLVDKVLQSCL